MKITLAICLAALAPSCATEALDADALVGVWIATHDEDGTPPDIFEIQTNGIYVSHGIGCNIREEMPTHWFRGDLYVTAEIPGKGPVAIVFRPSSDGTKLTFTSPRTRNNATYERLPSNPCERKA